MITGIYLESTKDKNEPKKCDSPLFEKRWANIKPYKYETLKKDSLGEMKTTQLKAMVGDGRPITGNHFADDVQICSVRGEKSWA